MSRSKSPSLKTAREVQGFMAEARARGKEMNGRYADHRRDAAEPKDVLGDIPELALARIDAGAGLQVALREVVDLAQRCVIHFAGDDRGRYRSAHILLSAVEKAISAHDTDKLIDLALKAKANGLPPMLPALADADEETVTGLIEELKAREAEGDPLEALARDAAPYVNGTKSRSEWAQSLRTVVANAIRLMLTGVTRGEIGVEDAVDRPGFAAHCAWHIEAAICGAPVAEIRDLLPSLGDSASDQVRIEETTRVLLTYLQGTTSPDAEAIIRRVLARYGYDERKSRSLFEGEDKKMKRAARNRPE